MMQQEDYDRISKERRSNRDLLIELVHNSREQNRKIDALYHLEKNSMGQLTDRLTKLQAAVAAETTVDQSIETLLTQQGELLKSQVPDLTPAQSDAFDAALKAMADNAAGITASIVANTPAAATPPATGNTAGGGTLGGNTSAGGTVAGG